MSANKNNTPNRNDESIIEFAVSAWTALAEAYEERTGMEPNDEAVSQIIVSLIAQRKAGGRVVGL